MSPSFHFSVSIRVVVNPFSQSVCVSACVSGEGGGGGWRLSLGAISCFCQQSWGRTDSVLTIIIIMNT